LYVFGPAARNKLGNGKQIAIAAAFIVWGNEGASHFNDYFFPLQRGIHISSYLLFGLQQH
jgi:hypothetical protein